MPSLSKVIVKASLSRWCLIKCWKEKDCDITIPRPGSVFPEAKPRTKVQEQPCNSSCPKVSVTVMPFILLTCLLLNFPLLLNAPLPRLTHYLGFQSPIPMPKTALEGLCLRSWNPGLLWHLGANISTDFNTHIGRPKVQLPCSSVGQRLLTIVIFGR